VVAVHHPLKIPEIPEPPILKVVQTTYEVVLTTDTKNCLKHLGVIDVEAEGLDFEVVAVHHPREVSEIPAEQPF